MLDITARIFLLLCTGLLIQSDTVVSTDKHQLCGGFDRSTDKPSWEQVASTDEHQMCTGLDKSTNKPSWHQVMQDVDEIPGLEMLQLEASKVLDKFEGTSQEHNRDKVMVETMEDQFEEYLHDQGLEKKLAVKTKEDSFEEFFREEQMHSDYEQQQEQKPAADELMTNYASREFSKRILKILRTKLQELPAFLGPSEYQFYFCAPFVVSIIAFFVLITRPACSKHRALTITATTVIQAVACITIRWCLRWYVQRIAVSNLYAGLGNSMMSIYGTHCFYTWAIVRFCLAYIPMALATFTPYPDPESNKEWRNDPAFLEQIALVIPCHKCADGMKEVLESHLKIFEPQQICLVDNANSLTPPDNLRQVAAEVDPNIKYVFVPEGLKTQALHIGVESMSGYKYVLLMDDDTLMDEDMVFDESHFLEDDKVAGMGWTRNIITHNMATDCVNLQLKGKSGLVRGNSWYSLAGTNYFLVGIMALYRRDLWLKMAEKHPCTPYGEDMYTGSILLTMGYKIITEHRNFANTYSPPVITGACSVFDREQGYGAATLWKQRAMRWSCTGMRNVPWLLRHFFKHRCDDWHSSFFWRFLILNVLTTKVHLLLVHPMFYTMVSTLPIAIVLKFKILCFHLCMMVLDAFVNEMCINYINFHGQAKNQRSFVTVVCTAFLDIVLVFFTFVGSVKCLTYDIWHPAYKWKTGCWTKFKGLTAYPAGDDTQKESVQTNLLGNSDSIKAIKA